MIKKDSLVKIVSIYFLFFTSVIFGESLNDKIKEIGRLEKPESKIGEDDRIEALRREKIRKIREERRKRLEAKRLREQNKREDKNSEKEIEALIDEEKKREEAIKKAELKKLEEFRRRKEAKREKNITKEKKEVKSEERLKKQAEIIKKNEEALKRVENREKEEKKPKVEEEENLTPRMKRFKGLFELVKEKRKGLNLNRISFSRNPFFPDPAIQIAKKRVEEEKKLKVLKALKEDNATKVKINLLGIFDNKANINGKWIKINQKVGKYKLIKININSIIMLRNKKRETFSLRNKNGKIIFK